MKIAVLIDNMFEDAEYGKPAKAFTKAKHELVHISIKKGSVRGLKKRRPVLIEQRATEAHAEEFDALFIPGGYSPDQLRADEEVLAFVRRFVETGKPVFFICHGVQILISADVVRGRRVTGWKSLVMDIKNAGAEFIDQEVVEDGNFVSSRNPSDIPAFINACLHKLQNQPAEAFAA